MGILTCPATSVLGYIIQFLSWILNPLFEFIWHDKVSVGVSNWIVIILALLLIFWGLTTLLNKIVLNFLIGFENIRDNLIPRKAEKALKKVIRLVILVWLLQLLFFFVDNVGTCQTQIEGLPIESLKSTLDGTLNKGTEFLQQNFVWGFARYFLLPLGVFFILFNFIREVELFKSWINLVIAITISIIFSATPIFDEIMRNILANTVNFVVFVVLVLLMWRSWNLITVYGKHQFENPWHETKAIVHIVFFLVVGLIYSEFAKVLLYLISGWDPSVSGWIGFFVGLGLALWVWYTHYKLPYLIKKLLSEKKREVNEQINRINTQISDPSTSDIIRADLIKNVDFLNNRRIKIEVRIDEIEERIRKLEEH